MNSQDLVSIYQESSISKAIVETLEHKEMLRLKGIAGSYDALLLSSVLKSMGGIHLIVLHDKEEAAYFVNDLSNFLTDEYISFPSSYKKPYHFEEIENDMHTEAA